MACIQALARSAKGAVVGHTRQDVVGHQQGFALLVLDVQLGNTIMVVGNFLLELVLHALH